MNRNTYSIETAENITINGAMQNIRIRGTNPSNPILLFLHGGPGICDRHTVLKYHSGLADICTLVCWDQRGAGLSYHAKQAKQEHLTISDMIEDAAQVIRHLNEEFHTQKVSVLGHSWGSVLGVLLAQKYPELVEQYIGMGQFVSGPENELLSYQFTYQQAAKHADGYALSQLKKIGEPVEGRYSCVNDMTVQRKYLSKYGGAVFGESTPVIRSVLIPLLETSEYRLTDIPAYAKGSFYSLEELWDEVVSLNFRESVPSLNIPIWILQGNHDQNTPTILAKEWFNRLDAPSKHWVSFEHSAHHPIKEEPQKWEQTVRGIVTKQSSEQ
ncbi:MAG: alpha/beta fold hydrolase [Anaerofustis sp.]